MDADIIASRIRLKAGCVELEVHLSRTANLFHIVDQLAAWSPYCHGQYRHWREEQAGSEGVFSESEQQALVDHARIRGARSWGMGLEQTFYTPLNLDEALAAGIAAGHISPEQANVERNVLTCFAPRLEALLQAQWPTLTAFASRLTAETEALSAFATQIGRWMGVERLEVPVYLIANPSSSGGGGGFNSGRLTLEVSPVYDVYGVFLHELFHAFLDTARTVLQQAATGADGLDYETLNEGLAYALSPGLLFPIGASADPLRAHVRRDIAARKPLSDAYTRFNRFGLALRPLLEASLDDAQPMQAFLPRALDAWRVLVELSAALDGETVPDNSGAAPGTGQTPRKNLFVFGPCSRVIMDERWNRHDNFYGRGHDAAEYKAKLALARPGDRVVLLLTGETRETVPAEYADLLPAPLPHITAELQQGKSLELTGTAREWHVILLAAPTSAELASLIRETALLQSC